MPDLNPILAGQQSFQKQAAAGAVDMDSLYTQLQSASQDDMRTFETIGANQSLIETAKGNAELATQQAKLRKANDLGIDPSAKADLLTALSERYIQARATQQEAGKEVARKQSVGFFDNPLEHVLNQLTVNDDINKHNAAAQVADDVRQQYADINQMTQSTNATLGQLTQSITQASVDAGAQNAALQAKILASKSQREGLIYNVEGIKTALQISGQILQSQFSVLGAQQAQAHLNLAIAEAARRAEEFSWKKEEKAAAVQTDQMIWEQILKGRALRLQDDPLAGVDARSPKAQQIIGLLKSNSPIGKEFQDDWLAGEQGVLATSPSHALDILKSRKVDLAPAQGPVRNLLETAFANVGIEVRGSKDKAAIMAAVDANTKAIVDSQLAHVIPGDEKNVFNIPSITYLVQNSPELQKLALVSKVLAPRMAAGDQLSNPSDVFTAAMKAVQAGTITYQEAVIGLPSIYQRGVQTNLAARNLVSFGITPSEKNDMFQYNVDIAVNPTNLYGAKSIQDMTKIDVVSRAANTWFARSAAGLNSENPPEKMIKFNIGANEVHKKGQFYPDLTVPYGDQK